MYATALGVSVLPEKCFFHSEDLNLDSGHRGCSILREFPRLPVAEAIALPPLRPTALDMPSQPRSPALCAADDVFCFHLSAGHFSSSSLFTQTLLKLLPEFSFTCSEHPF